MSSAIVVGATGILGRQIVAELCKDPQKWTTIHALSRSQKEEYPSHVVHDYIDLTSSCTEMAKNLKHVQAEYIFFAAYLEKDTEQKNWDVNGAMLDNFLSALKETGAVAPLKRIILVTGAKQYGVHLGAVKLPMMESDPWLTGEDRPPNFYYNQQNILHKFCNENNKEWVVTYPNDVIGYAEGNFMNLATSVSLYALVNKELGGDLIFPGAPAFYTKFDCFTGSKIHASFCAWAALEPKAANQAFNIHNGDVESWQNLWPKLASYFGLRVKPNQFETTTTNPHAKRANTASPLTQAAEKIGEEKKDSGTGILSQAAAEVELSQRFSLDQSESKLDPRPPINDHAETLGLIHHPVTAQSKVIQQIDLGNWSKRKDVREAWDRLAQREGLKKDAFEKATWGFLGFELGRDYDLVISMSKARKFGFTGYVDTWECLEDVLGELEGARILPQRK